MNLNKPNQKLPVLYSKTIIFAFSVIFSTLFGAVLLLSNLKEIGQSKARIHVTFFATVYLLISMLFLINFPKLQYLTFVFNVTGAAVLNEYFWNKFIGKDTEHQTKNWTKPALISFGIALILVYLTLKAAGSIAQ